MKNDKIIKIVLCMLVITVVFCIGYLGGIKRAVYSAELVSYTSEGYEIDFAIAGTHSYN